LKLKEQKTNMMTLFCGQLKVK